MTHRLFLLACVSFACAGYAQVSFAAQQPDAGQTLQGLRDAPSAPVRSAPLPFDVPVRGSDMLSGGAQVILQQISISGNSVFSQEELLAVIGDDARGRSFDLAGLKGLAQKITAFYHAQDYPFSRAFIPAQDMAQGNLEIVVVEGRYGKKRIQGDDGRAAQAEKYLHVMEGGAPILGRDLERVSLILDDQPGYRFTPVIRPGQEMGTGDLFYKMETDQKIGGSVRVDNHGNRYTGRARGQGDLYVNSPFMFGDQFRMNAIYTDENMWFGSANYTVPLGYSGLRGSVGYAHTYYELGKNFASLDAHGTAQIASAGLSYPLLRSQEANVSLSGLYQHKWLKDEQGSSGTSNRKTSHVLPVSLSFDVRDGVMGGAVTYGALSWSHGILDLDSGLASSDRTTAKSEGHFDKVNLDVVRLQMLPVSGLVLYARASGQYALDNLDSSEDFGLGGVNGVRAYPLGEAYGDSGALGQVELRYSLQNVTPYVFYDYGYSRVNHDPWTSGDNSRSIGGGGIGARIEYGKWSADASAAWRNVGNKPKSDDKDYFPMVWVGVGYKF